MQRTFSVLAFVSLLAFSFSPTPAHAQLADVPGPGQPVSRPVSQCPQTLACTYDERTIGPAGYRFQSLTVCGANCTTQYWISAIADGKQFVEVKPTRGGGMIAVERDSDAGGRPAIRTIVPSFTGSDPACCPSSYVDTTYTWDAAKGAMVPSEPVSTPVTADDEIDWIDAHDMLMQDGFIEVFGGP